MSVVLLEHVPESKDSSDSDLCHEEGDELVFVMWITFPTNHLFF